MFEVSISRQILHYYIFLKSFVNVKTHNFYQMLNKNKIFYIIAIIHFNLFFFGDKFQNLQHDNSIDTNLYSLFLFIFFFRWYNGCSQM